MCGAADYRRADALAAGPVLDAYEAALRQAFGDDPTVILVRRVEAELAVNLAAPGRPPAETWGRAMAAAVLRTIALDAGSGNVVRFPDEAAHLAAFVAEAADGRPADDWVFDRFARFRHHDPADTVRAALLDRPELVTGTIRRLAATGRLAPVLRLIGPAAAARLWFEGVVREAPRSADADRPLFAAALGLIEAAVGVKLDGRRAEEVFAAFLVGRDTPTDWRDRTRLADVVADAVRFLAVRLGAPWSPGPEVIDRAVAALDWLDLPRLKERLLDPPAPTLRPRHGPTPRQRLWLDALVAVAPRVAADLDRTDLRSPRNALLVFAALTTDHPGWADDPAVPGFIAAVLAAASGAADARKLGDAAAPVIRAFAGRSVSTNVIEHGTPTDAAGVFLLLRAVIDLRLAALSLRCGFPGSGPHRLLAALAARWAGRPLEPEPGLLAFAGIEPGEAADGLQHGWGNEAEAAVIFQGELARMLLAQRLVADPRRFRVAIVPDPRGGLLAVGGHEPLQVWPFAAPVEAAGGAGPWVAGESAPVAPGGRDRPAPLRCEATATALARWAAAWRDLTGSPPTVIHPASVEPPPGFPTEVCDEVPHALSATVESLSAGATGDPHADAALTAAAAAGVRVWARWLKHIGHSSTPYLLGQLIRRPGRLIRDADSLTVELEPRPLDVALQLSGYLDPIELPPGAPVRVVRFRVGGVA
jgi:hypothetical protein